MRFSAAFVSAALAAVAAAQSAAPARNGSHGFTLPNPSNPTDKSLILYVSSVRTIYNILPLTTEAETQVPFGPSVGVGLNGNLFLNTPQTYGQLKAGDFAFTSCDASDYTANGNGIGIGISDVVNQAIKVKAAAIIFYSRKLPYCNITDAADYHPYASLYSMFVRNNSVGISNFLKRAGQKRQHGDAIFTYLAFQKFESSQSPLGGLGGTGSTAVAMIILYSITGVITALFLIIIVTGAIRAHRHPERYGPRNVLGRARQSRAKGIARAMLDTLPIVKFGEREDDVPKDAEIGSNIGLEERSPEHTDETITSRYDAQASTDASDSQPAASNDITAVTAAATSSPDDVPSTEKQAHSDEAQGCSICTDDFEIGQDIRVLPCNHKFHPACVDPWLLEVSGTCPLCRVDLQPAAPTEGEDGSPSDELPPPLDPSAVDDAHAAAASRRRDTIRSFLGPRFNRRGLQGTSGEERLEMLRRWREASRRHSSVPNGAEASASATATTATTTNGEPATEEETTRASRLSRFSRIIKRRRDDTT